MKEYTFSNMEELAEFCHERKHDSARHYYWGTIENFHGLVYTIEELNGDRDADWFRDGAEVSVYEFDVPSFNRYIAYGHGDAGNFTMFGIGDSYMGAFKDSEKYGYDLASNIPYLSVDRLSDKAYEYIMLQGCNDMESEYLSWDQNEGYLMTKEEGICWKSR